MASLSRELKTCDGIVGSRRSGAAGARIAEELFLWCNAQELSHKPGLIVAVGRRLGGSYPVVELRMSSYKKPNSAGSEHVIVRNVEAFLTTRAQ